MSACNGFHDYLNRRMSGDEAEAFERHMERCEQCQSSRDQWTGIRAALTDAVDDVMPTPNEFRAKALVRRATETGHSRHANFWLKPAIVGGIAVAATILFVLFLNHPQPAGVPSATSALKPAAFAVLYPPKSDIGTRETVPELLSASDDEPLLVRLGRGKLGIQPRSRARVKRADSESIQLELIHGVIGVDLPPARKRETLSIQAGDYKVSVVGTRFWVARRNVETVEVGVERGVVRVFSPNGDVQTVSAGKKLLARRVSELSIESASTSELSTVDQLLDPSVFRPESLGGQDANTGNDIVSSKPEKARNEVAVSKRKRGAQASFNQDQIKQWVLNGQFNQAEREIQKQLMSRPSDVALLNLLATCQRKAGKSDAALKTYDRIIQNGGPAARNAARFKGGVILQEQLGRHAAAVRHFEAYLATDPSNRPNTIEARTRLARSLKRLGDTARYRKALETIVRLHGGTEAAVRASKELQMLDTR